MAEPQKMTNDDRFEVMQQAIDELRALIMARLDTAETRVQALSAQSSIDVMGLKADEPHTKRGMGTFGADGWDTSAQQKAIMDALETKVVVNSQPINTLDASAIATAVVIALKQTDKKVA